MGGKDDDDDKPMAVDVRQDWIAAKVCETLKIKKDKFDNMEEVLPLQLVCPVAARLTSSDFRNPCFR